VGYHLQLEKLEKQGGDVDHSQLEKLEKQERMLTTRSLKSLKINIFYFIYF
jgi:hypothetical protein